MQDYFGSDLEEVQREVAPAPCPFYFERRPEHPKTWGAIKAEIRAEFGKRFDKLKEAFNFLRDRLSSSV
jgi:hypothetical protein